jgi:hypothetical protein
MFLQSVAGALTVLQQVSQGKWGRIPPATPATCNEYGTSVTRLLHN